MLPYAAGEQHKWLRGIGPPPFRCLRQPQWDVAQRGVLDGLGTWKAWAGDAARWPVTTEGAEVVEWAIATTADFFGDEWHAEMLRRGRHPLMNVWDWPRCSPTAIVHVVERAARIALLPAAARDSLREQARATFEPAHFDHLDLLLEVAGLAVRDGWALEAERPTPAGRSPDLFLTRHGAAFSVEVTQQGMDREMRLVEEFDRQLGDAMFAMRVHYGVDFSGEAGREAVEGLDLAAFVSQLAHVAAQVRDRGEPLPVEAVGIDMTVWPSGSMPGTPSFSFPPVGGDCWERTSRRLVDKARQTEGGPPAWLRLDEAGGMFLFTGWAQRPLDEQLRLLAENVQAALCGFPHVRGVVMSAGAEPLWQNSLPERSVWAQALGMGSDACALDRVLPGQRCRRTFVVPVQSRRIVLPRHLEAEPHAWYGAEGSWLGWALRRLGHPPPEVVLGTRTRQLLAV